MADEKKAVSTPRESAAREKKEPNVFVKIGRWFKNLGLKIGRSFKEMYGELRNHVSWPDKQKLIRYSIVVLLFMLFFGVVVGLFDLGSSALIQLVKQINPVNPA